MKSNISISVTGHRPFDLFGYEGDKYSNLFISIRKVFSNVLNLYDTLTVITGGAQGVDQIAFWSAHTLKVKTGRVVTTVAIPFKGQENPWKEQGTFGKKEYRTILCNADNVIYLSDEYRSNRQYTIRDMYMVDNSDVLLSVLNPNSTKVNSGTKLTTNYAISKNVPVIFLNPITLEVSYPESLHI